MSPLLFFPSLISCWCSHLLKPPGGLSKEPMDRATQVCLPGQEGQRELIEEQMENIKHKIFTQKVTFYGENFLKLDSGSGTQLREYTANN